MCESLNKYIDAPIYAKIVFELRDLDDKFGTWEIYVPEFSDDKQQPLKITQY